jgi:formylglycine-generating enzyme required for sulfatase activity
MTRATSGLSTAIRTTAVVALVAAGASCGGPSTPAAGSGRAAPQAVVDPAAPRFRADAWFLPNDDLLGFVEVPAGPFLMGSDPASDPLAFDNERWLDADATGSVDVPAYFIGRYEVTVAQYKAFVDATGRTVAPGTLTAPLDHPVASVSWPDALAYCRWLDAALKKWTGTPAPLSRALADGARVGLPSEAEWEKAARGTDRRLYPWGNEPRRDRANFLGQGTTAVGSYACPECPFGLADMSGNVWEWTRSPFRAQGYRLAEPPIDLDADALWIMRGGSFGDPARNVRVGGDPGARRPFIGFRLVIARH